MSGQTTRTIAAMKIDVKSTTFVATTSAIRARTETIQFAAGEYQP